MANLSQLWDVACYMGSHSVTCYLSPWNSVSSLKATDGPSDLPLTTCAQRHVCTTASETEALELPVCEFGIICLVAGDICLVSEGNRRSLRSSFDKMYAVPRTHNSFRDRSFVAAGPRIWNNLPRGWWHPSRFWRQPTVPPVFLWQHVCGATYAQQLPRQKLWSCRSVNLE